MAKRKKNIKDVDAIREFVHDCIATHNEEVLIDLIARQQQDYSELATLSTFGQYQKNWSHKKVLDYITKEI